MTEGRSSRAVLFWFAALSVAELVTVALLLVNLFTVHWRPITSIGGPVHGGFYLAVVPIAVRAQGFRRRTRLLSIIPVFGGAYVLWFVRSLREPERVNGTSRIR